MRQNFVLLIAITLILCSCHNPRFIYVPAPATNPNFTRKGESKLTGYYVGDANTHQKIDGFQLQGAYAVSDHFAITADYFNTKERSTYNNYHSINIFDSSDVKYRRQFGEIGAGYFMPMNSRKNIYFSVFAGIGTGKFSMDDRGILDSATYARHYESETLKFYIQPSFNFIFKDYFRLSLTNRFSGIRYKEKKNDYTEAEKDNLHLRNIQKTTIGFFEPSINLQFGSPKARWIKVDAGVTLCSDHEADYLEARSFIPYIGLSFDLSKVAKK